MSPITCVEASDGLPDWVAGRLSSWEADGMAEHVRSCAECAAQVATIRAVVSARPTVPADLAARIGSALRAAEADPAPRRRGPRRWTSWAASAAAVLVLAVGTLVVRYGDPAAPTELGAMAADGSVWIADDGIVAGAPLLDELSDDALATLLEEMGG